MGEAKRRGTFEERKAAAIERNGMDYEERKRRLELEKHILKEREHIQRRRLLNFYQSLGIHLLGL